MNSGPDYWLISRAATPRLGSACGPMLTVLRDPLPECYLLVVASRPRAADPHALERALHRAGRSGKPAVWLDCGLLAPPDVTQDLCLLLRAYHEAFARMGLRFAVAHASAELREGLAATGDPNAPPLVGWLGEPGEPPGAAGRQTAGISLTSSGQWPMQGDERLRNPSRIQSLRNGPQG